MIMMSTKTAMMTEIDKIIDTPTLITKRIPITTMGNFPTNNHTTKMVLIITIIMAITTTIMDGTMISIYMFQQIMGLLGNKN